MSLTPSSRKIRLADAAEAIDVTVATIANWIAKKLVKMSSSTMKKSGWHEFTLRDVQHFALVKILISYGLPVSEANNCALAALPDRNLLVWRAGNAWVPSQNEHDRKSLKHCVIIDVPTVFADIEAKLSCR